MPGSPPCPARTPTGCDDHNAWDPLFRQWVTLHRRPLDAAAMALAAPELVGSTISPRSVVPVRVHRRCAGSSGWMSIAMAAAGS